MFLVWPLGGLFIAFKLGLSGFELSLLVLHFCLAKLVVVNLIYLSLILSILDILCKNRTLKIRMISEEENRLVQNPYEGFFTFLE